MASNSYLDNSGLAYFLTKLASWIPAWFPSQTGQSGKVLTTDGFSLSWTAQAGGDVRLVEAWRSSDGRLWYRKWSDGWIEQGGYHPSTGNWNDYAENLNTSFNTPFVNAKNTVQITMVGKGDLANPTNVTSTKFTLWIGDRLQATGVTDAFYWYACGY